MSPTCSKAALRVLVSTLLASSIANAAALPHQALDARADLQLSDITLADVALGAIAAASSDLPENTLDENTFDEISDNLNNKSAFQVMMEFFTRLFGPDDVDAAPTESVSATPTPTPSEASSSIVLPPGPPSTSTEVTSSSVTSAVSSITSAPTSDMMSILPIGNMSTAINSTFLTPSFVTAPEETPISTPDVPPFPANSTTSASSLPTAASITGMFSVNPIPTPSAESNATETVNTTSTTVIVETIIPTPIGTNPAASAGTGSPIAISESAIWANTTTSTIGASIVLPGTGIGAPIAVGTASPIASFSESALYPNTTSMSMTPSAFVTQVPLTVTGLPGSVVEVSVSIPSGPYANASASAPAVMSTGAPVASILPIFSSESSYFNTTTTIGVPVASGTAAPISAGTGAPVLSFTEAPLFPNTTATVTDIAVETATATLILPPVVEPSDVAIEFPGELDITDLFGGYH